MRIHTTREGKRFVLAVVVVGFAALNTGNNLMYLTFSMMVAILILSILVGMLNLRGLVSEFHIAGPVFAGSVSRIFVRLQNQKRFLPSYSIRFIIKDLLHRGVYCHKIPPAGGVTFSEKIIFPKRGIYTIEDAHLQTGFPFIFFYIKNKLSGSGRVVVYPRLFDTLITREILFSSTLASGRQMALSGDEFHGIRQYRPGDIWRNIHWKSTAKTGRLMVKEFSTQRPRRITVILDTTKEGDLFEKAVSLAATVVYEAIVNTYQIRLITASRAFQYGSDTEHLWKILEFLAAIKPSEPYQYGLSDSENDYRILILIDQSSPLQNLLHLADRVFYASSL